MRIALVSQAYPPQTARGGIGTQTYLKAHGLASRGHEVHVLAHSGGAAKRQERDGNVLVTRIPGFEDALPNQTEPVQWLTYSTAVAIALAELHAQTPLDLVDFPEWGCEGYVYLLNQTADLPAVAVHLHGPLIMFAHRLGWPELDSDFFHVGRHMEETCLRLADAVFSSSHCSARWCAEHYGLDLAQIPVLHTGIDTQLFRPTNDAKESRPTILFVGHIARNKGVELLVEAGCRLAAKHPNLCLRMLGRDNGRLIPQLQSSACGAGFPKLLEFPGFVGRDELPAHLSRAHVFAAPSLYEGGPGFVYLEAMACELPAVACAGSGASEAIVPEETGLLVPPTDCDALVQALDRLLEDPAACQEMGRNGRRHVLKQADSAQCLDRMEAFYCEVAERHKSRPA